MEEPFAAAEIRRLDELRVEAAELAIDADLAAGLHREVLPEIERLADEHPLREHVHAQRMLALYRCGRQAAALAAFHDARGILVESVGLEPGLELQRLQGAVLRQDASLDVASTLADLPGELDPAGAPAIVGRGRDLAWLRARWARALGGRGGLVAVTGEGGIGKTRLVAELASEVHGAGGCVLFVSGSARSEAVVAALERVRPARRPTLLVVDEADAGAGVMDQLVELAGELSGKPVLLLAIARTAIGDRRAESLSLQPLDGAAVHQIARLYGSEDAVSVSELLAASRGVPGRAHELASDWALRAATRRVVAVAPRAALGRRELRWAEDELAGGVVALQHTRESVDRLHGDDTASACPFKGLASFEVGDAAYFFGRERLVAELVARVAGASLLCVVGPSGSGKSSVVKAGLLAALAGGVLPGSVEWPQVVIRPGQHPMHELQAAALERRNTVLAVDQFEELFTACSDERERAAFVDALVARAQAGHGLVVVAVRADFYGRCAAYPGLSKLLGANNVLVGAMRDDELRRAIERPARRVGLHVDADLAEALVDEVAGEPGGLPLLSSALLELWEAREARTLSLTAYARTGGVRGALARLAEDAFGRLDAEQQRLARRLMLRLAGENAGGSPVRRRVGLSELDGERRADVATVLGVLTERRLLSVSATSVEVAHEALLREWPRLRDWLEQDAEGRRVLRHLADAARDWDACGRDPADLYRGARLAVALEWRSGHDEEFNPVERAFLDAGRAAAQRAHRRFRLAFAGVAALLVLALVAGLLAVHQRGEALQQARAADAQRIGLQALSEPRLDRALLLAREAVALDDSPTTRSDLLAALLRGPAVTAVFPGTGGAMTALDVHRDGRTLALGDDRGRLSFVDARTRRRIGTSRNAGAAIAAVRFSPDGTRAAVAGYTNDDLGFIDLLDSRGHRVCSRLSTGFDSLIQVSGVLAVGTLVFSPDSRVLAADILADGPPSGYRRYIVRWDARTGRRLGPPTAITTRRPSANWGSGVPVLAERRDPGASLVGFTAAGARLVTSSVTDGTTTIRDATTLRPVRRFRGAGTPAAVSTDGRVAALALGDGRLRILNLRTGRARVARPTRGSVTALRFAPGSSHQLLIARRSAPPVVWDATRATRIDTLSGAADVTRLTVTADGATAFGTGKQGDVVAWDLTGARGFQRSFQAGAAPAGIAAVTSAGRAFAVLSRAGYVDVIDSRTLKRLRRVRAAAATRLAISPDGRTMAIATPSGALWFIDLETTRALGPPQLTHVGRVMSLTFSPDGRWLASTGADGAVYLWDARRRMTVKHYPSPMGSTFRPPTGLSFNANATRLALTIPHSDANAEVSVLSVPHLAPLAKVPVTAARQTQFSRDGRRVFYRDDSGRMWTVNVRRQETRALPMPGHANPGDFALTPDDRMLATTSGDGTSQLWDVASGRSIGSSLNVGVPRPLKLTFVAGGTALVALADVGRGAVWDLRPRSWQARACAIAGRPLTRAEWQDALPGRAYAPACAHGTR
jgi:WD40 repeat protein